MLTGTVEIKHRCITEYVDMVTKNATVTVPLERGKFVPKFAAAQLRVEFQT